jgi:diacylglycerol O-acyltransferase / wax synthase
MTDKFGKFLGPVDTAFYFVESDTAPMNIGSVSIFDGVIDFAEVLQTVDTRIHRAPVYQQKVIQAPLSLGQPMWVYDPDFHIENHVFQTQVDAPGDDEALRQTTSRLLSSPLDRSKSLWEITVVYGLSGNRTAFFFKIHHAMVDGLAAVDLFTLLFDLSADVPPLEEKPLYDPPEAPSTAELLFESIRRDPSHKWNVLKKVGGDILNIANVFQERNQRKKALYGVANIVNDSLKPIGRLPINGQNSGEHELAWTEFSLSEVRAIKSNRNASVNDVVLSIYGGAIARYVKEHDPDNKQEFLRVLVPVSMRLEQEKGTFGNRISVLPIDIEFDADDPLARLDQVSTFSKVMKESALSNGLDLLLTMPSLAPSATQTVIWGLAPMAFSVIAHTWCTNVAGPMIPVYFRGHRLVKNYGYFPLNPSMGLACVVLSYNHRVSMTLVADKAIVPDVTILRDYLYDAFEELRSVAKVKPMEPIQMKHETPIRKTTPPIARKKTANGQSQNNRRDVGVMQADHPNEIKIPVDDDTPKNNFPTQEPIKPLAGTKKPVNTPEKPAEPDLPEASEPVKTEPAPPPAEPTPAKAAEPEPTPTELEPVVDEAPQGKPKLFSDRWAKAYMEAINNNPAYYEASTKWTAGPLAFIMKKSAKDGFPQDAAVLLDLHKGRCRAASAVPLKEAYDQASFVIEGDYNNWMKVLSGQAQPLGMLIRGKLKLKQGAITRLMPFTNSAQELIKSAQNI